MKKSSRFSNILISIFVFFLCIGFGGSTYAGLSDGLVAHWPFDGNANDETGNGNDGVVNGATLVADRNGQANSAYYLDGVDNYIDIGSGVKPPFPVTVSYWMNPNIDLDCGEALIFRNDQVDSGSYRYGLATNLYDDGHLRSIYYEGFSSGTNRISYSTGPIVVIDNWYHFTAIFNAHLDISMYINGVEVPSTYDTSGTGSGMSYSGASGAIGNYKTNIGIPRWCYFHGVVDDVRVYDRALSEGEIAELYEGSTNSKPDISVKGGFFNLDVTQGDTPLVEDCNTTQHYGRMVFDEIHDLLYICSPSGWVAK